MGKILINFLGVEGLLLFTSNATQPNALKYNAFLWDQICWKHFLGRTFV